nr:hypothetical protein [Tanacetum cinerariifolium]
LQKLISQLEILGESIPEILKKSAIRKQSLDDLFNNLKIYEAEVKSSSPSSHNTKNIAFVSSNNTDNTNESVSAISSVSAASSKAPVSTLPNHDQLVAMIGAFRLMKNLQIIPSRHLPPHVHQVPQALKMRDNALVELRKKFEKAKKEKDELKLTLEKFQTSIKNLSKLLESQISDKTGLGYDNQLFKSQVFNCDELNSSDSDDSMPTSPVHDRYKSGEGYHVVHPPYTRTFMPPKLDLVFSDAPPASTTVLNVVHVDSSTNKTIMEMSKTFRPDALIIEDWTYDFEYEYKPESVSNQKEPSFIQTTEQVKTPRASVKTAEHPKQAKNLRTVHQVPQALKMR